MKKAVLGLAMAVVFSVGAGLVPQVTYPQINSVCAAAQMDTEEVITAEGFGFMPAGRPLGQAKLMARRAAIADAQRNLLETIKGTAVDAETTVEDFVTTSDVIKTKVSGMIRGAKVIAEKFEADGTYSVTMEVPLYGAGSVADVAINAVVGDAPAVPVAAPSAPVAAPAAPAPAAPAAPAPSYNAPAPAAPAAPAPSYNAPAPAAPAASAPAYNAPAARGGYTGLVIDAKNSGLVRTFCPAIYDTNGRAVYGVKNVDKDYAINHGVAEYAAGSERWSEVEKGMTRAGANPLVIKIVSLRPRIANKCDVIISVEDAERILAENQRTNFMGNYAVVLEM